MFQWTLNRRPSAIAALATLALAATASPALAAGPVPGPAHRHHDPVRGIVHAVAGALGVCDTGHRVGHAPIRRVVTPAGAHAIIDGRCHTWVSSGWQVHHEQVCVEPARTRRVWVAPRYGSRYDNCGRVIRVVVEAGYWKSVTVPARYETRATRVWREGHWAVCADGCDGGRLERQVGRGHDQRGEWRRELRDRRDFRELRERRGDRRGRHG
jgi:hypothetical protein